ncbi:unnamed protein product [Cochlearia groenlandica]
MRIVNSHKKKLLQCSSGKATMTPGRYSDMISHDAKGRGSTICTQCHDSIVDADVMTPIVDVDVLNQKERKRNQPFYNNDLQNGNAKTRRCLSVYCMKVISQFLRKAKQKELVLISQSPNKELTKVHLLMNGVKEIPTQKWLHSLSFDIECAGLKGHFSKAKHDHVIQVDDQPYATIVVCRRNCLVF